MKYYIIIIPILLITALYIYYENKFLKISKYNIKSSKLPVSFNGLKLIQISDFHDEKSVRLCNSLINTIKKEKPDIIVVTGDIVTKDITPFKIFIDNISTVAPIYFATGNHDLSHPNYENIEIELINSGIKVLRNKKQYIKRDNDRIAISGIDDPRLQHKKSGVSENEIVKSEIKKCKIEDKVYNILLSHRPEKFEIYVKEKLDLVFCGHAHGGQFRLPIIGGFFAPEQGLFPKFTAGLHKKNNATMIVNRGIGKSRFPFRINNRPELVIVTLTIDKEDKE